MLKLETCLSMVLLILLVAGFALASCAAPVVAAAPFAEGAP
jgi:hypothetical protein